MEADRIDTGGAAGGGGRGALNGAAVDKDIDAHGDAMMGSHFATGFEGSERGLRRKKVAIVGGGPTRRYAPYKDKSWDIWAFSSRDAPYPRINRWFEIHSPTDLRQQLATKKRGRRTFANYVNFMRRLKCPVYMQKRFKYIPTSVPFPKEKLVDVFGRCFTSTASFLVALAIAEGYKVIGLWGINPKGKDYGRQRPALEYLLSIAHRRGIRLLFPKGVKFNISKAPKRFHTRVLYAYDWKSPDAWWRDRVRKRKSR